jgi:hypothetical protein
MRREDQVTWIIFSFYVFMGGCTVIAYDIVDEDEDCTWFLALVGIGWPFFVTIALLVNLFSKQAEAEEDEE